MTPAPTGTPATTRHLPLWFRAACAGIVCLAFFTVWKIGFRGVFFIDQSVVMDGGWRVLNGQVPYRDFFIQFTPMVFFVQALFFWLFGYSWSSMVLSAAVVNMAASCSVIRTTYLVIGRRSLLLPLFGGLMMASLFQSVFGTLWIELTAFFFALLGLQCVLEAEHGIGRRFRGVTIAAGGAMIGLAILSKQNAGTMMAPLIAGVAFLQVRGLRRALTDTVVLMLGCAAVLLSFEVWLMIWSDSARFFHHAVSLPLEIAKSRTSGLAGTVRGLLRRFPAEAQVPHFLAMAAGLPLLVLALFNWRRKPEFAQAVGPVSFLAFSLPVMLTVFQQTAHQDEQDLYALSGVALCFGVGAMLVFYQVSGLGTALKQHGVLSPTSLRLAGASFALVIALVSATLVLFGLNWGWDRRTNSFSQDATFQHTVHAPGLNGLLWGEPTRYSLKYVIERKDFEDLAAYLQQRDVNFYVHGDMSLLYGMLGKPSPAPLLLSLMGQTFAKEDIPFFDQKTLAGLRRHNVQIVVHERQRAMNSKFPQTFAETLPATWQWVQSDFRLDRKFGYFDVWERHSAGPQAVAQKR